MFVTSSKRSQTVREDDQQDSPRGPYQPWYRAGYPWGLAAIVVAAVVIAWPSVTGNPGSFDFWLWILIVALVVAWAGSLLRAWWRRGRKPLTERP